MLHTRKETAAITGLSAHELRLGAIQGRYPFVYCGNKRMFDPEMIRQVLLEQMHANMLAAGAGAGDPKGGLWPPEPEDTHQRSAGRNPRRGESRGAGDPRGGEA